MKKWKNLQRYDRYGRYGDGYLEKNTGDDEKTSYNTFISCNSNEIRDIPRWRLHFEIVIKGNEFFVNLCSKEIANSVYLADQLFDDQREELPVVKVKFQITSGITDEVIRNLAVHGFSWVGDRYFYLATKDISQNKSYFCRQTDDSIHNSYSLWSKLGSIRSLRSIPEIGMRLGLLVSASYPGFTYIDASDLEVTVIPDTKGSSEGAISTDGSGFISIDLVSENYFPSYITHGVANSAITCDGMEDVQSGWSLAYQIRLLCRQGIFKGTLIVDPYLKGKRIILRESMAKLSLISPSSMSDPSVIALSLVNSAPRFLCPNSKYCKKLHDYTLQEEGSSPDLVRYCCGCPLPSGHLNRHLILILHHSCQIPIQLFFELVRLVDSLPSPPYALRRESYKYLQELCFNISCALNRCHTRCFIPSTYSKSHDSILFPVSPCNNLGVAETLISCGYGAAHPLALAILSHTRQSLFSQLLQCRVSCRGSCYLLGLPDPTQCLTSDEVFVPGWSACECRSQYRDIFGEGDTAAPEAFTMLSANILVSRFPLHSPHGIRKLRLINDCFCCSRAKVDLLHYFNPHGRFIPDVGGVIIFGSNPSLLGRYRCPVVDDMNGDYDGDLYWICTDQRLVNSFHDFVECESQCVDIPTSFTHATLTSPSEHGDPPLVQSHIEQGCSETWSQNLALSDCRYLQMISMDATEIRSSPTEHLMEALLWEGLTPFTLAHESTQHIVCHHDILTKYLRMVATSSGVAKCEHLWNIKADIHGIGSSGAEYYQQLHDKLLISRKHGYYLSEFLNHDSPPISLSDIHNMSADYLPPHYLLAHQDSKPRSSQHYYSTSILGKLCDLVRELDSHNSAITVVADDALLPFELDQHLQIDFDLCCCHSAYSDCFHGTEHQITGVASQSSSEFTSIKSKYLLTARGFFLRFVTEMSDLSSSSFGNEMQSTNRGDDHAVIFLSHRTQLIQRYQQKFLSLALQLFHQCGRCSSCDSETPLAFCHLNSALKLSSAIYEVSHLLVTSPVKPSMRSRDVKLMLDCWLLCGGFLAELKNKRRDSSFVIP